MAEDESTDTRHSTLTVRNTNTFTGRLNHPYFCIPNHGADVQLAVCSWIIHTIKLFQHKTTDSLLYCYWLCSHMFTSHHPSKLFRWSMMLIYELVIEIIKIFIFLYGGCYKFTIKKNCEIETRTRTTARQTLQTMEYWFTYPYDVFLTQKPFCTMDSIHLSHPIRSVLQPYEISRSNKYVRKWVSVINLNCNFPGRLDPSGLLNQWLAMTVLVPSV